MRMDRDSAGSVDIGSDRQSLCRDIVCTGNTFVVRVRLVDGHVAEAWSTGRMMRNMDVLLQGGLDVQGRPTFAQQAHCLCNDGHALAAIRALEDMAGLVLPNSAVLVRSMVQSLRCIQEHLLHVYQFHLSDWVRLEPALRADPAGAARLTRRSGEDVAYFHRAQDRLRSLVRDQASCFLGGESQSHPDYLDTDEFHLLLHAHGLDALRIGCVINRALVLLGCGPEGFRAYHLGGLPDDLALDRGTLDQLHGLFVECLDFVRDVFFADMECLGRTYVHWAEQGRGSTFLAWEDFLDRPDHGLLFPGGLLVPGGGKDGDHTSWTANAPCSEFIREEREPDWSVEDMNRYRLLPCGGPSFEWGGGEYLWLSAPRHGDDACEVGALARVLGGWVGGRAKVCRAMESLLDGCGLAPAAMDSTMGRVLSRGIESLVLAQSLPDWLDGLDAALAADVGCTRGDCNLPSSGRGVGRVEVPRGTLCHTIQLEKGRIVDHEYLIPSLWNFSPRDSRGERGPLERALLGTPVADPSHPLEILRTVHELDPCNACLIVIEDIDTGQTTVANAK